MRQKFASLTHDVITSISETRIEVRHLIAFLQQIESVKCEAGSQCLLFTTEFAHKIKIVCVKVNDVFGMLKDYYSWFNFDLIEDIVNAFCIEDTHVKANLSSYKAHMRQYCKNLLCRFPDSLNGFGKHRDNAKSCVFKTDEQWTTMRLRDLKSVKQTICDILKLRRVALFLQAASGVCVELTFDIPQHVAAIVFPLSEDQIEALKEHGIQYCDIDKSPPQSGKP